MPLTVFLPRWPAGRLIRALYNLAAISTISLKTLSFSCRWFHLGSNLPFLVVC